MTYPNQNWIEQDEARHGEACTDYEIAKSAGRDEAEEYYQSFVPTEPVDPSDYPDEPPLRSD